MKIKQRKIQFKKSVSYIFMILILIAIETCNVINASALKKIKYQQYAENNIWFYDGDEELCYSANSMSGDSNFEKVARYYAGANPFGVHLSAEAIAGILANFIKESGVSPFRNQGQEETRTGDMSNDNGYGIAQFSEREKILGPLRTDSRTASFFNDYYKEEYGGTIGIGDNGKPGVPEGVPIEVNDAWLAVELDFITGGEMVSTKVGRFRNVGGNMGLDDYITDDMTILEALQAARSASDAARIFTWIYERPADKEARATEREVLAESILSEVKSLAGNSIPGGNGGSGGGPVGKVTIIGDSITAIGHVYNRLNEEIPNADVEAAPGKHFAQDSNDAAGPSGTTILEQKVNDGSVGDIILFLLGTNDSGGVTSAQAQKVVDLAGGRQLFFITNVYSEAEIQSNTNVFNLMASQNPNVSVIDWAGAIRGKESEYLVDGVHPNREGQDLFVDIILAALRSFMGSGSAEICADGGSDALLAGGMTLEQAQAWMNQKYIPEARQKIHGQYPKSDRPDPFNKTAINDHAKTGQGTLNNCVAFSQWFVNAYTTAGPRYGEGGMGNGYEVASKLIASGKGFTDGGCTPAVYSIMSYGNGGTGNNHTAVVLGIFPETNSIIFGEASYSDGFVENHWPGAHSYELSKFSCGGEMGATYAYTNNVLTSVDAGGGL